MPRTPIYGLMAEFDNAEQLLGAVRRAAAEGYQEMDAYTPYPVEGLAAELDLHRSRVPFIVLVGGIVGCCVGYFMQYYAMAVDYPLNVGGRPYNSWPIFIPITFELTVLVAALSAVIGMLALNGLPMPYHPVFNVPRFVLASRDRFFFCIEATDPKFDRQGSREFLAGLGPREVVEVPH
jgi:Protein of unknown function (DUF3341)